MPPFVNMQCTNCGKPNRFDLAELLKKGSSLVKGVIYHEEKQDMEEFEVTCQHCGRKFKFMIRGENNGKTQRI